MNSKRKGKEGELELARLLRSYGFLDCRRSQQYCGISGDADVIGLPGIHIECKRNETLNIKEAMEQSERDTLFGFEIPVVMHRKNRKPWYVTMRVSDFIELFNGVSFEKEGMVHLLLPDWIKLYRQIESSK